MSRYAKSTGQELLNQVSILGNIRLRVGSFWIQTSPSRLGCLLVLTVMLTFPLIQEILKVLIDCEFFEVIDVDLYM